MTGAEAAKILQHPVFGDERGIDAIEVMRIAKALLEARRDAKRRGIKRKFDSSIFGHIDPANPIASMEHDRIENELEYWKQCGWTQE
jgi:hypothetical protein